jgi:hypothetical protein
MRSAPKSSGAPWGTVVVALFVVLAAAPGVTRATPAEIFPLDRIRPGMKGYGLTVFQGEKPERFNAEVIGVLHNFLPKQDIVLMQSKDPSMQHAGVVAGMSGSPIYIDGKIVGALAYGWRFSKDPIFGVTPIGSMLAELRRPTRGVDKTPLALGETPPGGASQAALTAGHGWWRDVGRERWMARLPGALSTGLLPARGEPSLVRATVPLSVAGFGSAARALLDEALRPFGVVAFEGGGGGRATAPRRSAGSKGATTAPFEPGSAIGVELMRGDASVVSTGTVTYVEGSRLVGFGHPMFNVGEIYLPVARATIHTFLPALSTSFKVSSPLETVGSLVQDRQPGIVADTTLSAQMLPVHTTLRLGAGVTRTSNVEVARHRSLTPMLVGTALMNAAQESAADVSPAAITLHAKVAVRGFPPIDLTDRLVSQDGLSTGAISRSRGLRAIGDVLFNPWQTAHIDRVDVDIDVAYRFDGWAEIRELRLGADELEPGQTTHLYVTLRTFDGPDILKVIPLAIPSSLAGSTLKVEVTAGSELRPDVASPRKLADLLHNLAQAYPADAMVVSLQLPDEGLALRGHVVRDLPASAVDALRPASSSERGDSFRHSLRTVVPMDRVIQGKQEIQVKVREEVLR